MQKKRIVLAVLIVLGIFFVVGATLIAVRIFTPNISPLPEAIQKQLSFSALVVPEDNEDLKTSDIRFESVEDGTRVLSYTITLQDRKVLVSQYPQPSQFNDVEGYRERFLDNVIQQTSSISTAGGTVFLGQMAKQENKPMAVLLEKGLIVFMAPDQSLSEDQWRMIGDELMLVKPAR